MSASCDCRHGVLAFGDSITNAGGELQWGVALQSWALWLARGLGLPYTGYAVDGAVVADVVGEQLPAFAARAAAPQARYDVGCLYIGVNDVRGFDWDASAFRAAHRAALAEITARSDRTLALTAPLGLGLPRAGAKVLELNAAIAANAAGLGALVVDLSDFGARNHVMADRVHPTAFGQIAIAERALAVLAADGLPTRVPPAALIRYETSWRGRLRGDLSYAYRTGKELARAVGRRLPTG
ncbi:MAG TPA: GDSL-type esterase/lipase family protein [Solirubrobacteraceae bacterium]